MKTKLNLATDETPMEHGRPVRSVLECDGQARRAGISVENGLQNNSSSVGAASSGGRTEDAAPTGLKTLSAVVRQRCRAYGAGASTARSVILSALCFILHHSASAQYAIPWFKIAGGGGLQSTGGVYSVSGTIGQPDAGGPMTNGQYSITGGFWALPAVVQTPGTPTLTIVPATPGQAAISWTPGTPGFVLQETWSLAPANWTNSLSGATNPITVPAVLPTKFYRLLKP